MAITEPKLAKMEFEPWQSAMLSSLWNELPRELGRCGVKTFPSSMFRYEPVDNEHFRIRANFGLGPVKLIIPYFIINKEMDNAIAWGCFLHETANTLMGMSIQHWQQEKGFTTDEGVSKIKW